MRRIVLVFFTALLILSLPIGVFASTTPSVSAPSVQNHTAVANDGTCQVSLTVEFKLDTPVENLTFPVPKNAKNITVNSSPARISHNDSSIDVKLNRLIGNLPGNFTLMFSYSLPNSVAYDKNGVLLLTLPLLSGFSYPIEKMDFTISLPGEFTAQPNFSSGYYHATIENQMTFQISGTNITGSVTSPLKDQETLTMTLEVPNTLFPQKEISKWTAGIDDFAMYICAGLALVYWLIFLRCLPPRVHRSSLVPDNISAGQLGMVIAGRPADLTMMVMNWAQLGYLMIHLDTNGRIYLYKQMEMGNERSNFENRCFKWLFNKKSMVEGTGSAYARLCQRVAAAPPDHPEYFERRSGNPRILWMIASGIGLFGGISFGLALGGKGFFGTFLAIIFAVLGAISSWVLQNAMGTVQLSDKTDLLISAGIGIFWLIIGAFAGEFGVALGMILLLVFFGLAGAYGGRRTEAGRMAVSQILGLRRYLRNVNRAELQHITQSDPEFFFALAPYAIALGVDQSFAKRFGAGKLPSCTYITTGMDGHLNALEWDNLMRTAVKRLSYRYRRMRLDRYRGIIH